MGDVRQPLGDDRRWRTSGNSWADFLGARKRWVITFAATAVSTYALDAVATAAEVLAKRLGMGWRLDLTPLRSTEALSCKHRH